MSKVAAVVFFMDDTGPHPTRVAVQRKDWLHPNPAMRNRISGFGGIVEPGESALQCVIREVEEELPGWQDGLDEAGRYRHLGRFDGGVGEGARWTWEIFVGEAEISPEHFRLGCRVCTEGMFEVHCLDDLIRRAREEPQDFLPGLAAVIGGAPGFHPSVRMDG